MPIDYVPSLPPVPAGMTVGQLAILREQLQEDTLQAMIAFQQNTSGSSRTLDLVRDFGAPTDGSSNATAAWQEALAALSSGSRKNWQLTVPAYTYLIDTPLVLTGAPTQGASIIGLGGPIFSGPCLRYVGAATTSPLLTLRGVTNTRLDNLTFDANSLADFALLLASNQPAGGGANFWNKFYGCTFTSARGVNADSACLGLGEPGIAYQVSEIDWLTCNFFGAYGSTKNCILQRNSGNCKNFRFWGGVAAYADVAFNFADSSGSYEIHGVFVGAVKTHGFKTGANGYFSIHAVEFEAAGSDTPRFLVGTAGANGTGCEILGCEIDTALPADDIGIQFAGSLSIKHNQFRNSRNGSSEFRIQSEAQLVPGSAGPGSVISEGNWYIQTPAGGAPIYDSGGNRLLNSTYARTVESQVRSEFDYGGTAGALVRLINTRAAWSSNSLLEMITADVTPAYHGRMTQAVARWDLTYTNFQVAALTKDLVLHSPRVASNGDRIVAAYLSVTQAFAGTAGTLVFRVGTTVGGQELLLDRDATATVALYGKAPGTDIGTAFTAGTSMAAYIDPVAYSIRIRLTSSVGNLSGLSAGAVSVWLVTEQLP